jgi:LPXTG-motif cell wall-anchored protein
MAGTLLYAVGFGIVGLCTGFWQLAGCMFVISLGELVNSPASMSIVSRMARQECRGRYMSFADVMNSAGFAFGPAVGGFLMDRYAGSIETMWLLLGGLLVVCVFGILLLRRKVRGQIDNPS